MGPVRVRIRSQQKEEDKPGSALASRKRIVRLLFTFATVNRLLALVKIQRFSQIAGRQATLFGKCLIAFVDSLQQWQIEYPANQSQNRGGVIKAVFNMVFSGER